MGAGLSLTDARIELRDGDRAFRLDIAALELAPGTALALTGASGSGKTLLLELLGLLRAPAPGTGFRWRDAAGGETDLAALWRGGARGRRLAELRGALFGFVPQTGGLMPFLTVAENVELPQRVTGQGDAAWTEALIERLGLADVASLRPGALSIGQRQRTAIARALAHRPPFVIADEPTAALDTTTQRQVLDLLKRLRERFGVAYLFISHDRRVLAEMADRLLVMDHDG